MIIHFICRGNSFRSIIAEAYLNSLEIRDLSVLSSGTTAASDKARNLIYYKMTLDLLSKHGIQEFAKADYGDQLTQSRLEEADITVCMNQRVYDESLRCATFLAGPRIWSVADIGEPGRISSSESEREFHREEAYEEIVTNVDRLILEISAAKPVLTRVAYEETRSHIRSAGRLPGPVPGDAALALSGSLLSAKLADRHFTRPQSRWAGGFSDGTVGRARPDCTQDLPPL